MELTIREVKLAVRSLARDPAISGIVIATIALGVAALSTVFSFIDSAFYRPLPYSNANRIVALSSIGPKRTVEWSKQPLQVVQAVRAQARVFERVGAFSERRSVLLSTSGEQTLVGVTAVDSAILSMIGATTMVGRLLTPQEIVQETPLALMSDSLWRIRFDADTAIIGRTVDLAGVAYQVIGILRPGLRFYLRSDVLVPLIERLEPIAPENSDQYSMLGLMKSGVSHEDAQLDITAVGRGLALQDPRFRSWRLLVQPGMFDRGDGSVLEVYAWLLVATTVCVLLIACTNVANLLLARADTRRVTMVIRAAMGANHWQLIRQGVWEGLLLGLAAGICGIALTVWGSNIIRATVPLYGLPAWVRLGVDWRISVFAITISLVAMVAIGLTPANEAARFDLATAIRQSDAVGASPKVNRNARRGVIAQSALSLALVVCALSLRQSYLHLSRVDFGYDADIVVRGSISLTSRRFTDPGQIRDFFNVATARLEASTLVAGVALRGNAGRLISDDSAHTRANVRSSTSSLTSEDPFGIYLPESPNQRVDVGASAVLRRWTVSDDYFGVLGIPIQSGRSFTAADRASTVPVAVISDKCAKELWHGKQAIGLMFRVGITGSLIQIVGIAKDTRAVVDGRAGMRPEAVCEIYLSDRQAQVYNTAVLVRARDRTTAVPGLLRSVIRSVDRDALLTVAEPLGDEARRPLQIVRLLGAVMGIFALCALILSSIGIYGMISYGVTRRTREIGLRIALGSSQREVTQFFVVDTVRVVGRGMAIGVLLALMLNQLFRFYLFDVSPADPMVFAATIALFLSISILASLVPARRASQVDPVHALRAD